MHRRGSGTLLRGPAYAVVCVRRGDYEPLGQMLQDSYYASCLQQLDPSLPVAFVGDDQAYLATLAEHTRQAGARDLRQAASVADDPAVHDFWVIAAATSVAMANSTFCWWATSVGDQCHGTQGRAVLFPEGWLRGHGEALHSVCLGRRGRVVTGAACETRRIERLSCTSRTADLAAAVGPGHPGTQRRRDDRASARRARRTTLSTTVRAGRRRQHVHGRHGRHEPRVPSKGGLGGRSSRPTPSRPRGTARNHGVAATTAPLLLFCDPDNRVGPGWVAAMVATLDHAEIVGGWLRPDAGNARDGCGSHPATPGRRESVSPSSTAGCGSHRPPASDAAAAAPSRRRAASPIVRAAKIWNSRSPFPGRRASGCHRARRLRLFCRQTAAGFVRQQRADHRANAANLALAGRLPATGATHGPWQLARAMASYAHREHIWHPRFHALLVQLEWVRRQAAPWSGCRRCNPDPDHAEAMLPPSAPLLGGLLFDVSMEAWPIGSSEIRPTHMCWLAESSACARRAHLSPCSGQVTGSRQLPRRSQRVRQVRWWCSMNTPTALAERNLARHRRRVPAVLTGDPARFVATAPEQHGQGIVHTFCVHSLGSRERALLTDLVVAQPAASIIVNLTAHGGSPPAQRLPEDAPNRWCSS